MTNYIRLTLFRVSEVLEAWAGDQRLPSDKWSGVCGNLAQISKLFFTADWEALIAVAATTWPEYSGHPRYPVPHPDLLPETAYTAKWKVEKWSGEYGESRRRLCQHVADWIRENPLRAEQILSWR